MILGMNVSSAELHRVGELVTALFSLPFILFSMAGGFFIVPIAALLQHRPNPAEKGEVLAAANLLSFVGIFVASGAYYLLTDVAGWSPCQIFSLAAC